jgi:hypothetical protein
MTGELHCGDNLYEAPAVIDLKEAGLTHASGKADKCEGRHKVPAAAVTINLAEAGLVPLDDLPDLGKVLQNLHEQAHPDGTQFWETCREPGCVEAADLPSWV